MIAFELFGQALLMAAVALGMWAAMGDGMVLARFRRWIEQTDDVGPFVGGGPQAVQQTKQVPVFPSWIRNPIASCPRCMCSFWGVAALLVFGFGVGVQLNLVPDGTMTFNAAMELVPVDRPWVVVDWSRLAQIPALILAACGIQELWHRP